MVKIKNLLVYLFISVVACSHAQDNIDYKKEYSKTTIDGSDINEFTSESVYLIIELSHEKIMDLVKNGKFHLLRRLDNSLYIIKIEGGVKNLEMFSEATYLAAVNNEWKLSRSLKQSASKINDQINLTVFGLEKIELERYLIESGVNDYKILNAHNEVSVIESSNSAIIDLLKNHHEITFIDVASPIVIEETVLSEHDLAINRVNKIHNDFPTIDGQGFTVSIKEDLFDILDLDLNGRTVVSGLESSTISNHATEMATIIGGAGNSFIKGKGVAFGVNFTSSSFENILPDDAAIYENLEISVQNHSYGTALPDNRYSAEAVLYDKNTNEHPTLLHVFSSGNIGIESAAEGTYKDLEGYANLSGSFKMAKNTILVNAVNEDGEIDDRNSNGPAYDGRLKPELVAYGKKGTSESAAMVTGTALLLQQLYEQKEGVLPSSSLLKAALIAGADDIGAIGIDFKTGYGNLNASTSMNIINSNNYLSGELIEGEQLSYSLEVPENVHQLKIVLAWTDPAANPEDVFALVNDLDLKLRNNGTSEEWLPWVLNESADLSSLAETAVRKEDHLNNVEYVTIDLPTVGSYSIIVNSASLFTTAQKFDVVYVWNYVNEFEWTYPSSSDVINTNELTTLRWDTTAPLISDVEININNTNWVTILSDVDLSDGRVEWTSAVSTSVAKLRVNINGEYIESDEFILAPLIEHSIGFDCEDKFMLEWRAEEGVESYNVYKPGNKYLELIANTIDTLLELDKNNYAELNYSVSPVFSMYEGNKSLAYNYENQGVSCYYRNFLLSNVNNEYVDIELNMSSVYNVDKIIVEKHLENEDFIEVVTIVPTNYQLKYNFEDYNPLNDFSFYRARILLNNGDEIVIDEVEIFFPDHQAMLFFPNPIQQLDYFTLYSKGDGAKLQMLDLIGNVVIQWEVNSNVSHHTLPTLNKGMYILQLKRGNTTFGRDRIVVY